MATSDFDDFPIQEVSETQEMLPGYRIDPLTGAWTSLPWPTDPDERRRIAANSLGPLVIRWAENRLTPEEFEEFGPGLIDYKTGEDWRFTDGQKKFLILWYWYDDDGRFYYRSGVKRGAKGTGKDPFAAAHGNCELVGPTQLVWDDEKGWTGQQHRMPLVQVAANSEAQAKDTLLIANVMWGEAAREWHSIETGMTRTLLKGRGKFEVLTASEASAEGDPASFIILNESHHMTRSSGGHVVSEVASRNVGKSPRDIQARMCEYTNAHQMGPDSIAEKSFLAWQLQTSGQTIGKKDILYDSIEADPNLRITVPEELELALAQAYSDAHWADLERLRDEVLDPRRTPAESIRFFLNGLAVREDAWIDPRNFDALADATVVIAPKTSIVMFLDCSKSGDATGLVACRVDDGYTFTLGVWAPPHGAKGWRAPREKVDTAVRNAFDDYKVLWFGVDPSPALDDEEDALYWADLIDEWHRDLHKKVKVWATPGNTTGNAVKFDMRLSQKGGVERNKAFTEMAELVSKWIDDDRAFRHDGHPGLRQHTHNARRRPNQWGVSLGKESRDSKKHVDLAVCMVGAHLGRRLVLNNPNVRTSNGVERPKRRVVVMN